MDFSSSVMKIDELHEDNIHSRKHHILLVLSRKELDEHLDEDSPGPGIDEYRTWSRGDRNKNDIIGIALSDTHLEQVKHALIR